MQLEISKLKVKVLGDVHLGRSFRTGVPLNRIGDREQWQFRTFVESISTGDEPVHICMGDLFDRFVVSTNTLIETYMAYAEASSRNPTRSFFIIQGNHDISRDTDKASSFDVLELLLKGFQNIYFVRKPMVMNFPEPVLFMPYDAFKTGKELFQEVPDQNYAAIFGHYDITCIAGNEPHNLAPLDMMAPRTKMLVTGHEHNAKTFYHGQMMVIITGSMQPYTFAEDPYGTIYKTMTLQEFEKERAAGFDFTWVCLRLILQEGEQLPADVNCLQIIAKNQAVDEEQQIEVELIDFDMGKLFSEAMDEAGVIDQVIREEVMNIYTKIKEESVVT